VHENDIQLSSHVRNPFGRRRSAAKFAVSY
jgi:hypothetical protein